MSDRFTIRSAEHGVVRLFLVDLPPEEIDGFDAEAALGVGPLDAAQVEFFAVSDLEGVGLTGYLRDGLGIAEEDIDPVHLDAIKGHVLVLRSAAFGGRAVTLEVRAPLRWIGTYTEEKAPVKFEPLPAGSAAPQEPASAPEKRPSDAAMSGRVAMIALLVIFALTGLMVWIAG